MRPEAGPESTPHNQTPEKFEELRVDYSDAQGSLNLLAYFHEQTQRLGESPLLLCHSNCRQHCELWKRGKEGVGPSQIEIVNSLVSF